MIKKIIKETPIIWNAIRFLLGIIRPKKFAGSKKYWEQRYLKNGNSGSGSYGALSVFKSEIVNSFVENNNIETVLELGCGDGNQLQLGNYNKYIGLDVSKEAIEICKRKFKEDTSKYFEVSSESFFIRNRTNKSDLTLSLDVIYHLIEDVVFEKYMFNLFDMSSKYVIIYSNNDVNDANSNEHIKFRKFSDWISENVSKDWKLHEYVKNIYPYNEADSSNTTFADFYIYKRIRSKM